MEFLTKQESKLPDLPASPPFKFARFVGGGIDYWLTYADAFGSKTNRSYFFQVQQVSTIK